MRSGNLDYEAARAREDGELLDAEPLTMRDGIYIGLGAVLTFGAWWMGLLS